MAGPRRCVVFGGSGRLGQAICDELGKAGARVAFTYLRGEEAARSLEARLSGALVRKVDLADVGALEQAALALTEGLGGVDAFIHAAAVSTTTDPPSFDKIAEIDPSGWDRLMAINVRSAFFGVKALLPALTASRGNVVLMGSIDGVRSVPTSAHYATSKGALRAMTLALSKELGPVGIKVNMVAPGMLEGGLSQNVPADLRAEYIKHCGLRRPGRFEEIASLVAFIALSNTYMTGQALVADGSL